MCPDGSPSVVPLCPVASAFGQPSLAQRMTTSDRGSLTGSGLSSAASTNPKIALFAPIPIVSDTTTAIVRIGARRSCRTAYRTSATSDSSHSVIVDLDSSQSATQHDINKALCLGA